MAGLIQVLLIWAIIIFIIRRKKSTSSGGGQKQTPNTTVTTGGANNNQSNGQTMRNRNPQGEHWGQRTPASAPAAQTVKAQEDDGSTTAYLAKKAQEDAREHAKEKWEEEKRLRESRGGLAVAERHLDGDPIPQNKRCVVCGYCAAENMVPMMARTRYSCYFCREPL